MRKARRMGNYIQYLANEKHISTKQLSELLGISFLDVKGLFKGTFLLSFPQIKLLSSVLGISIENLIKGNDEIYRQSVVHCVNDFDNEDNREEILDIIESYISLSNSVTDV